MITPFLAAVAEAHYHSYGEEITQMAFVFPNRRAALFFQKYLAEQVRKPIFSPAVFTINDLFFKLGGVTPADKIGMLFTLYHHYIRLSTSTESFDAFLFWGEMLLNDFDDVDKYMVDARQLFSNIKDLKEIEDQFSYLSSDQIAAILRFWKNFTTGDESDKKRDFITLWELLYPIYSAFKAELKSQGMAYEGMVFREIAERAKRKEAFDIAYSKIVFVGLNALTKAEKILMKYLQDTSRADFYWDYTGEMLQDGENKASFFMKENVIDFPSQLNLNYSEQANDLPQIEMIGIPSVVGQAKQAGYILHTLVQSGNLDASQAINTALILPEESLLYPLLYSIPADISPINVTMGYPLTHSPVVGLIQCIFELQKQIRHVNSECQFYYKSVLALLSHRYVQQYDPETAGRIVTEIKRYNRIFIPQSDLSGSELLQLLFQQQQTAVDMAVYLMEILSRLHTYITDEEDEEGVQGDIVIKVNRLEQEFIYHYYITISRLKDSLATENIDVSVDTFLKLIDKITASLSVPFMGEPLSGLQIMGILETRALDFENLIILSMNEGIFPLKKAANSFIPYNLRKGFGLSTYQHQDSIYAYYFYRMLSRAKRVYFLYDTRSEGLQTGEVSRYIYQLKYLYQIPITEKVITYDIAVQSPQTISVEKTGHVLQLLDQFKSGGSRALSASAINTFIDCPLRFYFEYIERIRPDEDVTEGIEADMFGTLFHGVMEILYNRFKGKIITADLLQRIQHDNASLTEAIEESFTTNYFHSQRPRKLTGRHFLAGEVIRKYVKRVLTVDREITPFIYIDSEQKVELDFVVNPQLTVRLKAFVDRLDRVGNSLRIIDYKTGDGVLEFKQMQDLFDSALPHRPKAVLQVFLYAMLYADVEKNPIIPGVYYLRALYGSVFNSSVILNSEGSKKKIDNYHELNKNFKELLQECMIDIFDVNRPFTQCTKPDPCRYCHFTSICNR